MEKKISIDEMFDYIGEYLVEMTNDLAKDSEKNVFVKLMFGQSVLQQQKMLVIRETYDDMYKKVQEIYEMTKIARERS